MKTHYRILLLAVMLLPGCAMLPSSSRPPLPPPSQNSAVLALVETARQDAHEGRYPAAAAGLERALRIEPRNPVLWHELARVRLDEGQAAQAEQLASKSNTLAGANNALRSHNWRLIGHARAHGGDQAGAEAAFSKAQEIEAQL
jgi:predicted negative regulator of RcsB-dependent stress response